MDFLDDIRRSTWKMHPLQAQVVASDVCPKCHGKTLEPVTNGNGYRWKICTACDQAFYLGPPVTVSDG